VPRLEALEDRTLPTAYTFTLVADTSGSLFDLEGAPSINPSGTVAFRGVMRDTGVRGVYTGKGGPLTTIADTSGSFDFLDVPSINAAGTVSFDGQTNTFFQGTYTGKGGPVTTIFANFNPFLSVLRLPFLGPSINASGTVAFDVFTTMGIQGIYTGKGGPLTTIADTSGSFIDFSSPAINASGTVAFIGATSTGGGIYTGKGGPLTTIADTSGFDSFGLPSINNSGTVAFTAGLNTGGTGIFTGKGGPLTTIVTNTSPSSPFSAFGDPSINTSGAVAFIAELRGGGKGIYTWPDAVANKVIQTGDSLFGSTVTETGLYSSIYALNNSGQIAFFARLADGREVIVRADPVVGPLLKAAPPAAPGEGSGVDALDGGTALSNGAQVDGSSALVVALAAPASTLAIAPPLSAQPPAALGTGIDSLGAVTVTTDAAAPASVFALEAPQPAQDLLFAAWADDAAAPAWPDRLDLLGPGA
jgi:hypothetical protein